ncbi:MAG: holo-ACP synthase [Holosporaceae bacterium]|nr:MAG: holo-ACP synthase [Holosporaceae bacterium]
MIIGIGTDLVDIRRIQRLIDAQGARFLEKTFTHSEIEGASKYGTDQLRASYFAKRFAAKEAFAKATGKGFGEDVAFLGIEVHSKPSGQPCIKLHGKTKEILYKSFDKVKIKIDLSLSDEYPMAQANVVISTDNK